LPCAFLREGRDTTRWIISSFALRRSLLFLVSGILVGGVPIKLMRLALVVVCFEILGIFLMLQEYRLGWWW